MENKENAYLTCDCAEQCYSNWYNEELYREAPKTGSTKLWAMLPIALIDCFNMDCLMCKNYKQAMENLKNK